MLHSLFYAAGPKDLSQVSIAQETAGWPFVFYRAIKRSRGCGIHFVNDA
jgi:hypothetical protein